MKSNSILRVLVALAASSSALGLYALEPGRPDPRTRTFLPPARVVWTSGDAVYGNRSVVKNAESLLLPRHGQIPEERWRGVCGCAMENNGEPASVILDFGRELHGGLQIGSMCPRGMKMRVRFGESVGEVMSDIGTKSASNDHASKSATLAFASCGLTSSPRARSTSSAYAPFRLCGRCRASANSGVRTSA